MFKKQGLICLVFMAGVFSGCATMTPEMVQKKHAEWQSEVDRFEKVQGLSYSQAPELYDSSRLKVGSTVKIKHAFNKSKSLTTKTLYDIKSTESGNKYIINEINGSYTFTREGDPVAFSKVICEDKINYINLKDSLPATIVKGLQGGVLGVASNLYDRASSSGVNNQVLQVFKDRKRETKILDFKLVSQEKLTIANQIVPCRVYQVQAITRETYPSVSDSIADVTRKIWISDDVPFGLVRSEDSAVGYNASYFNKSPQDYRNRTGVTILTSAGNYSTGISEVVDFKY